MLGKQKNESQGKFKLIQSKKHNEMTLLRWLLIIGFRETDWCGYTENHALASTQPTIDRHQDYSLQRAGHR